MIQPIILAAGKGTRMRSAHPKTLYEVAGKPMLQHILDAVKTVSACVPPIIVVGHGKEEVVSYVDGRYVCVEQPKLSGTASAVRIALPHISKKTDAILVLYGDHPFIQKESLQRMADLFEKEQPVLVQSFLNIPDFEGEREIFRSFGRLVRDADGLLQKIVEYKNASPEEREIREVNSGICAIDVAWLAEALPQIQANPLTGEYYLTELVSLACDAGKKITTAEVSLQDALGVNSPEDAQRALQITQAPYMFAGH